ncbi:MAG TPA: sec-independent translocase, partial [Streptosporangiaceae bacterium]|nr:sec-independent translocase [Streptosporangiaceae bacterium]
PQLAAKAGRALRELRKIAEGATSDLREGLGPEFSDFDLNDLNPRRFVQKHILTDLDRDSADLVGASGRAPAAMLPAGEAPPYDAEAT